MPALDKDMIEKLEEKVNSYLKKKVGYKFDSYVNSGASAAIFKVTSPEGDRAVKVFDPKFFSGPKRESERKRLALQESLIGHKCQNLVTVYAVEEAEDTAFMEMEFVLWPSLIKLLPHIPDDKIQPLIYQLYKAVKFLEDKNIVHRDIKSDNIHVSPDFTKLILSSDKAAKAKPLAVRNPNEMDKIPAVVNSIPVIVARAGETVILLAQRGKVDLSTFLKHNDIPINHPVEAGEIYFLARKKTKRRFLQACY